MSSAVILFMGLNHQAKLQDKQKETEAAYTKLNHNLTNIESDAAEEAFESAASPVGFAYLAKILRRSPSHTAALRRSFSALKSRAIATPLSNIIRRQRVTNAPHFHRDSTLGVALDHDRALVFDSQTGTVLSDAPSHGGRLRMAQFSPDGTRLAVGDHGNYMSLWETETWTQVGQKMPHDGRITKALYSPTGEWFATVGYDGVAKLWDGKHGAQIANPLKHPGADAVMNVLQFWPDKQWLLTGNVLGNLALWRLPDGELIHEFDHHDSYISSVLFHPKNSHFVSLGTDSVRSWNTKTFKSEKIFPHAGRTFYAGFDADGTHLFTASFDRRLRVWDFETASLIPRYFGVELETANLAVNHPRNLLAVHSQGIVSVWNTATRRLVTDTISNGEEIVSLEFSPDGQKLAVASSSMEISFWNIPSAPTSLKEYRVESAELDIPGTPRFVPGTDHLLVSLKESGGVQLWDLSTNQSKEELSLSDSPISFATLNSTGTHLYAESSNSTGFLLGLDPLRILSSFDLPTGAPSKVARLNASGSRLVVVADRVQSSDSWLIAPHNGQILGDPITHETRPSFASVKSHGNRFVVAETFEKLHLGNFDNPPASSYTLPDRTGIVQLEMGQQTDLVALGRSDGSVEILESLPSPKLRFSARHNGSITSLGFNRDESLIASAATDGSVHIRYTESGNLLIRPLPHSSAIVFAAFSNDPTVVITLTSEAQLSYWDLVSGQVIWREPLTLGIPTQVTVDSQSEWMALRTSHDHNYVIRLPLIDIFEETTTPDWFPDLLDAVAGLKLINDDAPLAIPQEQRQQILNSILNRPKSDPVLAWAKAYIKDRFADWLEPSSE